MAQSRAALQLIASGVTMQFLGLLWGMAVPQTPFPRLALTAHIQAMAEGCMVLVAGLLVKQIDILDLSPLQCTVIVWSLNTSWLAILSEMANAYWGTQKMLPIAALAAGATGGAEWQEIVVSVSHFVAVTMLVGFGVLTYELCLGKKGLDLMGKSEAKASSRKTR